MGACTKLAELVHSTDGYPFRLPDDLRAFIASDQALGAWVAERDGKVIGHVALHARTTPAVMTMASVALGLPTHRLGVVSTHTAAIALYERCGWTRIGLVPFPVGDGTAVDEFVYVGPPD